MKLFIVCVLALLAVVASETCTSVADCTVTSCGNGYTLICAHDECTCTTNTGQGCTHSNECHNHCNNQGHGGHGHCVNGNCVCH